VNTCAACGASNVDEAQFCSSCGAALRASCTTCGTPLPPDARFCPNCGAQVEQTAAGEERKIVTVLFADVTGSTALGEQLDPEHLRDVMATYFAAMREEIEAEGGTVEKFIGDAVMAAFGVPLAHEDDPARALRAAIRMRHRLDEVNDDLEDRHGVRLQVRIGVNTGDALATTDPKPGEPMVTGDVVNAAARLQAAAEPGSVVAGERTSRAVRGFRFEELGPLDLKGKSMPVSAHRLIGEVAPATDRGLPGLQAPMVGRDAEMEVLRSIFQRVTSESRPNLVTVYGDAGVGKSRLTREFLAWAERQGPAPAVLRGRCLPYGEGVTYWPLAEILKAAASVQDDDSPELALEKIRKAGTDLLTEDVTSDPGRTTAALAYTVGVEDPDYAFSDLDPKNVRAEVHSAWRSFFSALGSTAPTIIVVEDIHWADAALLDLLEDLAERVTGSVVLVCPARPELIGRRPGWGGGRRNFTSVALDPLTALESEYLVRELLAIDALPDRVRARILERGEGNPFFLEEILRHLIDGGLVARVNGSWRATDAVADVEIPDTVQAVLAARIDLLGVATKRALQGAAVVGREFWPGPVQMFTETSAAQVDEALGTLVDRDLIVSRMSSMISGEAEFSFKHVLTRDVAYASLPRRERALAHARVGSWIEGTAGNRVREFHELLAHHYSMAARAVGDSPEGPVADREALRMKAHHYLIAASIDARRRLVLQNAVRLAEEALDLAADDVERTDALEVLAEAHFVAYTGDVAWRHYRDAALLRSKAEPADDTRVAYLAARACEIPQRWPGSMQGELPTEPEVREMLDLGFRHLPPGDGEERIRLLGIRAGWPFAFPDPDITDEEAEAFQAAGVEAAEIAMRIGRPNLASGAFDSANAAWMSTGTYGRVLGLWERRRDVMPEVTDVLEIGDFYAMGAWSNCAIAEYERAAKIAEAGLGLVAGRAPSVELHLLAWRAVASHRLGRWDEALQDFASIRELLEERRDDPPYFAAHAFGIAALIHEVRGDGAESLRLTELLFGLRAENSARLHAWILRLFVERGELDRARHRARPTSWRVHACDVYEAEAERLALSGGWEAVPAFLAEVRAHAERAPAPSLVGFADRLEGRAALAGGDPTVAAELLGRARTTFTTLRTPWERALTEIDLARALSASADRAVVEETIGAALETFEELGATRDVARARRIAASL
jgi:class 3 adenylate cyclase/tetratricopeptide (TPR) repeat protein